jgi:hypothetical protein
MQDADAADVDARVTYPGSSRVEVFGEMGILIATSQAEDAAVSHLLLNLSYRETSDSDSRVAHPDSGPVKS